MSSRAKRGTCFIMVLAIACDSDTVNGPGTQPTAQSLDAQVRAAIAPWGVAPILPIKAQDPALVELGRALFNEKNLSGNRDVSCATCHRTDAGLGDNRSLSLGTGAKPQLTPRNAPGLFNSALGEFYMFWDGRVNEEQGLFRAKGPTGAPLPAGLNNLLAAQAMHPVTNRVEMRGQPGENEVADIPDSDPDRIWDVLMQRLLASGYLQKFNAAFPGVAAGTFKFTHAANAIAAFEAVTFTRTNSPFDRFLARQDNAMTADAKQGALLFFGKARCSSCHSGALLGGQQFASVGVPQLGPGTGKATPLDGGREDGFFGNQTALGPQFLFRVPPLRNVELTAPYFHNGAYATLEAVVRHYNNADSAVRSYDPAQQLAPELRALYRGDAATISKVTSSIDGRIRGGLGLTPDEQKQLVAFLKSLTDPSARQ